MPEPDWVERAECASIGAMLLEPERIPAVASIATASDYRSEKHRLIAGTLAEMSAAGEPIDLLTITQRLERAGKLAAAGGTAYLSRLLADTPTAAHAENYAREVKRAAGGRRHSVMAAKWSARTKQADYDPDAVSGELVSALTARGGDKRLRTISDVMGETLDDSSRPHPPIRTGVAGLDALFSALDRRMVAVVLAKPGVGKSALGAQLVISEAQRGAYCAVFSAEMSGVDLGYRWIAHSTGIERQWIWAAAQKPRPEDEGRWTQYAQAIDHYSAFGKRVLIDDTSQIGIDLLVMRAHLADQIARQDQEKRGVEQTGIDLILVDYLQLLKGSQDAKDGETREMQVTAASQALVTLAKALNCRVVLIASLSNAGTTRYSGGVDYDVQIRVTLEPADDGNEEHLIGKVSKNRDGPKGDIHLRYIGPRYLYQDWDSAPWPDPPPDRTQGRRVAEERERGGRDGR